MQRRRFLQGAAGIFVGLAGCGGGDGSGGGATTTATTTTVEENIQSAETGPYADWLVSLDGANVFLLTYYPEYNQLLEWLPPSGTKSRIEGTLAGPTHLVPSEKITSYFEGFTRNSETHLDYADLRGSFDTETIASQVVKIEGFTNAGEDAGPEGFATFRTETAAVGLAEDRILWAEASAGDPIARLGTVLATFRGKRKPYTATHADMKLLLGLLQTGHQIKVLPSNAEEFGATEYGRQFVFGPNRARPEEAVVFEEMPSDVRTRFKQSSVILDTYNDASLKRVKTDGRAAKAVFTTIPNSVV